MRYLRRLAASALVLCVVACATATRDRVSEGERLLAEGKPKEAAVVLKEALNTPGISGLDRTRAAIAEAHAYLLMGDLVGAETRLRRIEDTLPDKWYFLGRVAQAANLAAEARSHYQRALSMAYRGDTGQRLAILIAAEAHQPAAFLEAAAVARRGGATDLSTALAAAAEVWTKANAGHKAQSLLVKLDSIRRREGGKGTLQPIPALEVLRARLLEAAGRGDPAVWTLKDADPQPSVEFRAHAQRVAARMARQQDDMKSLKRVLETAEPATALQIRAEVADFRLSRGDLEGALEVVQLAASNKGGALAARYLDLLGRAKAAAAVRKLLGDERTAVDGLLLAPFDAERDPLGTADRLPAPSERTWPHLLDAEARAAEVREASGLVRAALRAESRGRTRHGEAAATLLLPGNQLLAALRDKKAQLRGVSRRELAAARATHALRDGRLKAARKALARHTDSSVLTTWLTEGLRRGLRQGHFKAARALLKAIKAKLPKEVANEIRASAGLAPLHATLGGKHGPPILKGAKRGPWGSLVHPKTGRRVPAVRVHEGRWAEPGESDHAFAELEPAKGSFFGASPGDPAEAQPFGAVTRPIRAVPPLEVQ
jgi:tetratricopeptide (TPR) repeat protein